MALGTSPPGIPHHSGPSESHGNKSHPRLLPPVLLLGQMETLQPWSSRERGRGGGRGRAPSPRPLPARQRSMGQGWPVMWLLGPGWGSKDERSEIRFVLGLHLVDSGLIHPGESSGWGWGGGVRNVSMCRKGLLGTRGSRGLQGCLQLHDEAGEGSSVDVCSYIMRLSAS